MKRRNSKKTGVIALIAGLSSVTLVSIGFASWVISGGVSTSIEGNLEAEEVSDARYLVSDVAIAYPTGFGAIHFGCDTVDGTTNEHPWLTGSDAKCNLEATVTFYVANLGVSDDAQVSVRFAAAEASAANWTAVTTTKGYVTDPTIVTTIASTGDDATKLVGELTYRKVTSVFTFDWGTTFNGDNPYTYFNNAAASADVIKEGTTTWGDYAKTVLGELNTLANSAKFKALIYTGDKIPA